MLQKLKSLFDGSGAALPGPGDSDRLQMAAACLLVEAALQDDDFEAEEEAVIARHLAQRFELEETEAGELIGKARTKIEETHELYGLTRTIKTSFDYEERVELLEMAWEVAYADGELHDFEANLLRRLAGLLYIEDRDSGLARKRVLKRLSLDA